MGKIIDIMISMTQIMSPSIECCLVVGITIMFFILHDKTIKSRREETIYKILFTILYCFTIIFFIFAVH